MDKTEINSRCLYQKESTKKKNYHDIKDWIYSANVINSKKLSIIIFFKVIRGTPIRELARTQNNYLCQSNISITRKFTEM